MSAAAEIEAVAGNVERFPTSAVRTATTGLRTAILASGRRDTGGDYVLSHDRRQERLAVTIEITGTGDTVTGLVLPGPRRAVSRWRWLDDGTRPRVQGTGRHPGTKGKRTVERAVDDAMPDVARQVADMFDEVAR